jgi:diguanylate cyclase (GGDEF)-like protein
VKILLAEGDSGICARLRELLQGWGYEVITVTTEAEAWAVLQSEDCPRLVVLDWMTSGIDGVELCRRVRARSHDSYTYIVLLTARTDSQDVVTGMEAGADDYITKPYDSAELRARLCAGRRILELQEQLVRARETLRDQAARDGLTGLWNRVSILEILDREISRARRERSPVAVVMADLDSFKAINDLCGHLTGDHVLGLAARRMQANIRQYDSVGRYGGEEFLMVLPGCDLEGAMAQAERVRSAIAAEPFAVPEQSRRVTCSFGVAVADGSVRINSHRLVREADAALYRAKRNGRNRVETLSSDLVLAGVSSTRPLQAIANQLWLAAPLS